jgi:hypothetical protein
MGPEPLILLIWLICLIGGLSLAVRSWRRQHRNVGAAALVGLAVGFAPIVLISGPPVLRALRLLALSAAIVLSLAYLVQGRLRRLLVFLIVVFATLVTALLLPRKMEWLQPAALVATVGEGLMLAAPFLTMLAVREFVRVIHFRLRTE